MFSEKKFKNYNIHRFFKKLFSHFTLLMVNGGIGNKVNVKEFFKDFGTGIKNGLNTVLDIGKQVIGTSGVKDLINIGTTAFGIPLPVGDMISSVVGIASNLLGGGGSQKRDILKDPNKYDFKSGYDQFSSLIKRKEGLIWKK
jgi:hypothetical protein